MFGQTAHSHLQQAGFDPARIMRELVARVLLLLDSSRRLSVLAPGQRDAPMRRIESVLAQGIALLAGGGQQRVQPQALVIVEIFVTQGQTHKPVGPATAAPNDPHKLAARPSWKHWARLASARG